jgi:hypothetical protein
MLPPDPLGMTAMYGVDARQDILPYLAGEMDLLVFPYRAGQRFSQPSIALVLALTDGPAFREKILELLQGIVGAERAEALAAVPGETVGGFTFYPIAPGASYAISQDFAVVTSVPDRLKEMVTRSGPGLGSIEATTYARINGDLLLDMITFVSEQAGDSGIEKAIIMEAMAAVGDEPIGTIELSATTSPGRLGLSMSAPRSVWSAEYRLIRNVVQAVPRIVAVEKLRAIVGKVDQALTRYGEEHGDTFPESLEALVAAGYLDAIPAGITPSPLGQFADGGYTYLPVRDDEGAVAGYYLLVYGVAPHLGYDLFDGKNQADPATFRPAGDGNKDGVVTFAYGGTAIPVVQEYFSK